MNDEQIKEAQEVVSNLYVGRKPGWLPILAFGFKSGGVTWVPKAEEGGNSPAKESVEKIGVWGGCVESIKCGFNCQPVQLLWAGIDVDAKGGHNESIADVPRAVVNALPEAHVRSSSSGKGAHVFLRLKEPKMFTNKAAAQAAATAIAAPYVERLTAAGIGADIVGRNQLWVCGGKQEKIWEGGTIDTPNLDTLDAATSHFTQPAVGKHDVVTRSLFGPMCTQILDALETNGVIRFEGGVSRKYLVHIARAQDALRTLPWLIPALNVRSTAKKLNEPNSILSVNNGTLTLWTFVEGGRKVFSFPIGL